MFQKIKKFLSYHVFFGARINFPRKILFTLRPSSSESLQKRHGATKFSAGFTLLIAMVTTSMLLLVSFVIIDIATKQLVLANAAESSQYAFYNADSGTECALYWDLKNPNNPGKSAFATSTSSGPISCGPTSQNQPVSTGSQTITTVPSGYGFSSPQQSVIGSSSHSVFSITFAQGCAIVVVTKENNGTTLVDSRGYNTCDTSSSRRFERGVTLSY